jgi:hypothetical protein
VRDTLAARPAAFGRRGNLLGSHHKVKGNYDVGLPGSDGAGTGVAGDQVAQGVREAVLEPVADHHPCSGFGCGKEPCGGRRLTHQFILGVPARFAGTGWGIIGSDVKSPAAAAGCKNRRVAGTNVERPGT